MTLLPPSGGFFMGKKTAAAEAEAVNFSALLQFDQVMHTQQRIETLPQTASEFEKAHKRLTQKPDPAALTGQNDGSTESGRRFQRSCEPHPQWGRTNEPPLQGGFVCVRSAAVTHHCSTPNPRNPLPSAKRPTTVNSPRCAALRATSALAASDCRHRPGESPSPIYRRAG